MGTPSTSNGELDCFTAYDFSESGNLEYMVRMKINQKYSKFKIDWEKTFNQKLKYHFDWDSL